MSWSLFFLVATAPIHVLTEGTHPLRLLLFLGFLLLLCIAARIHVPKSYSRFLAFAALFSVGAIFALSLFLHVQLVTSHSIPLRASAVFFSGSEMTNTRIEHVHTGKVAIATILPLASSFEDVADTGSALRDELPPWAGPVLLALLAVAILSALLSYSYIARRKDGLYQGLISLLLYGTFAFVTLEKSIDGGILNDGAIVAVAGYAALLFLPRHLFVRVLLLGGVACLVTIFAAAYYGYVLGHNALVSSMGNAGVLLLLGLALHALLLKRSIRTYALLALALLALFLKAGSDVAFRAGYLASSVREDGSYLATYAHESEPDLPLVTRINDLGVYRLNGEAGRISIGRAIDTYQVPYWYQPVSRLVGGSCTYPSQYREAQFSLFTPAALTQEVIEVPVYARLVLEKTHKNPQGWQGYSARLTYHPCVPRRYDVMKEMIEMLGTKRFLIYNVRLENVHVPPESVDKAVL